MRRLIAPLLMLALLAGVASAQPFIDDVFVGLGQSHCGMDTYRVGYLSGHGEAALICWRNGDEVVYGGVLTPVVAYYFGGPSAGARPYVGGGVGFSYISNTMMVGRDLSTRVLLEDRIGVGVAWRRLDACLSYVHYSNGSVVPPNQGIDSISLTVGWSLQE
jgi:hypothetical protein